MISVITATGSDSSSQVEKINITEIEEDESVEEIVPLEKYKNVKCKVLGFEQEFKKTWGTIKEINIEIDNMENQSVTIGYVTLKVEDYEDEHFELENPVEIDVGEQKISLPVHFSYKGSEKRKVRVKLRDENKRVIASYDTSFT